jgi:CTP:molybdopterin cytidylyltransferase MocA
VTAVVNSDWRSGLSSSLVTGLATVFADSSRDAVLVVLADQPLVDTGALKRLMDTFDEKRRIVASTYDGTIGVPAVFAREFAGELMQLTGDAGAGSWLRNRGDVTTVPLEAGAVDIDTESDLARLP